MKRVFVYLTVALLTFAAGIAVSLNLHRFRKSIEPKVTVASIPPEQSSPASAPYQSDVLNIVRAPNEPVSIVDVRFGDIGDLLVEVTNISPKSVIFAGYILAPFDHCPESDHPMSFGVGYGDWRMLSGDGTHKIDPPAPAGQKVILRVPRKTYELILNSQKRAKCPFSAKPDLYLDKVAFDDGSGWEGFADGVDHSEWNGRPWIPELTK